MNGVLKEEFSETMMFKDINIYIYIQEVEMQESMREGKKENVLYVRYILKICFNWRFLR